MAAHGQPRGRKPQPKRSPPPWVGERQAARRYLRSRNRDRIDRMLAGLPPEPRGE